MLALWEIAYIAGFFDGEGCIYAHPSKKLILSHNSRHHHNSVANTAITEKRLVLAKAITEAKKC